MATQPGQDAAEWTDRFVNVAQQPGAYTAPAPAGSRKWNTSFFDCFKPFDEALITCCCPCITFGKTHHRLRAGTAANEAYSPFNVSCIGYYCSMHCGLQFIFNMMQRGDIRNRANLEGDALTDCLRAWCCTCCDLMQQDKEVAYLQLQQPTLFSQPGLNQGMVVPGAGVQQPQMAAKEPLGQGFQQQQQHQMVHQNQDFQQQQLGTTGSPENGIEKKA